MSCYCTDTGEEKGRSLRRGRLCRSAGFCSVKFGLFPELHVSCGPQGVEKDLMAREWESEGSVLLCVTGPEMKQSMLGCWQGWAVTGRRLSWFAFFLFQDFLQMLLESIPEDKR